jgi:hypothetical protein
MLAIDVHDVIAEFMVGMAMRFGTPKTWVWGLQENWPLLDLTKFFETDYQAAFLAGLNPVPDAVEGTWYLHKMGVPFFYFTAAAPEMREVTELWMKAHLFPKAELVIAKGTTAKGEALRKLRNVTAILDDGPQIHGVAAEEGIHSYVFDRPWNRDVIFGTRVLGWRHFCYQIAGDLSLFGLSQ